MRFIYLGVRWMTLFICSFSFASYNCTSDSQSYNESNLKILDTVIKDIPRDKNGKLVWYYLMKNENEEKTGFGNIENGFDSLEIRIGMGYAFNDTAQVIVIRNSYSKWVAEFNTIKNNYTKGVERTILIKTPKSGWDYFITKLKTLQFFTLPDFHSFPDYLVPYDDDAVCVQIATKNSYRIYAYPSPLGNEDKIWQAKNIIQVLELIEAEFDFKRIRKF